MTFTEEMLAQLGERWRDETKDKWDEGGKAP
jgi:hypothetical protein